MEKYREFGDELVFKFVINMPKFIIFVKKIINFGVVFLWKPIIIDYFI